MILIFVLIGIIILTLGMWGCLRQKNFLYYSKDDKKSWDWRFRQACYDNESIYWALNAVGGIITGIFLLATLILGVSYSDIMIIDDKIAIYQEENEKIETQVNLIVENYQNYEKDTFKECKLEDPTFVFTMYPELKSNDLVSKQIDLYVENNKKIKELKTSKLDYEIMAWWLYFG